MKNLPFISDNVSTERAKYLYLNLVCNNLSKTIHDSIESTGNLRNIGGEIRNILHTFQNDLGTLEPFNKINMSDAKLTEIINSYDGFSQSIGGNANLNLIVENCFKDVELSPLDKILEYIYGCLDRLCDLLLNTIKYIIRNVNFEIDTIDTRQNINITEYAKLIEYFDETIDKILQKYKNTVKKLIDTHLKIVKSQGIWINDEDINTSAIDRREGQSEMFVNSVNSDLQNTKQKIYSVRKQKPNVLSFANEPAFNVNDTRSLLEVIFRRNLASIQELALKTICVSFINKFSTTVFTELTTEIHNIRDVDALFYTTPDGAHDAKVINNFIVEINEYMEYIDKFDLKV